MSHIQYDGLRYEALDAVERRLAPDTNPETPDACVVFAQIQTLEHYALKQLNQAGQSA